MHITLAPLKVTIKLIFVHFISFFVQEESKNWVTEENLEEKIAYCLENETNYNFAITPSGERIYSTTPPGCIDSEENAPGPAAYYPKGLPSNLEKQEVDGY